VSDTEKMGYSMFPLLQKLQKLQTFQIERDGFLIAGKLPGMMPQRRKQSWQLQSSCMLAY
jgi:hypothetical protein